MSKIRPISLLEWFIFGIGKFLMGFSLGLVLDVKIPSWVLLALIAGIIFEIPSLIAVYKHQSGSRDQRSRDALAKAK